MIHTPHPRKKLHLTHTPHRPRRPRRTHHHQKLRLSQRRLNQHTQLTRRQLLHITKHTKPPPLHHTPNRPRNHIPLHQPRNSPRHSPHPHPDAHADTTQTRHTSWKPPSRMHGPRPTIPRNRRTIPSDRLMPHTAAGRPSGNFRPPQAVRKHPNVSLRSGERSTVPQPGRLLPGPARAFASPTLRTLPVHSSSAPCNNNAHPLGCEL